MSTLIPNLNGHNVFVHVSILPEFPILSVALSVTQYKKNKHVTNRCTLFLNISLIITLFSLSESFGAPLLCPMALARYYIRIICVHSIVQS